MFGLGYIKMLPSAMEKWLSKRSDLSLSNIFVVHVFYHLNASEIWPDLRSGLFMGGALKEVDFHMYSTDLLQLIVKLYPILCMNAHHLDRIQAKTNCDDRH